MNEMIAKYLGNGGGEGKPQQDFSSSNQQLFSPSHSPIKSDNSMNEMIAAAGAPWSNLKEESLNYDDDTGKQEDKQQQSPLRPLKKRKTKTFTSKTKKKRRMTDAEIAAAAAGIGSSVKATTVAAKTTEERRRGRTWSETQSVVSPVATTGSPGLRKGTISMSRQEQDLCRKMIKNLTSKKNKKYNDPFLFPFHPIDTPGYLDVCHCRMDLATLTRYFEEGAYASRFEFYDDCNIIFTNALTYHANRSETKWILPRAKRMLVLVEKEQQLIEDKLKAKSSTSADKVDSEQTSSSTSSVTTTDDSIQNTAVSVRKKKSTAGAAIIKDPDTGTNVVAKSFLSTKAQRQLKRLAPHNAAGEMTESDNQYILTHALNEAKLKKQRSAAPSFNLMKGREGRKQKLISAAVPSGRKSKLHSSSFTKTIPIKKSHALKKKKKQISSKRIPPNIKSCAPSSTDRRVPDWEGVPEEPYPGDGGVWPEGWMKRVYGRLSKPDLKDRYWYAPDGTKFRSMAQVKKFLREDKDDPMTISSPSPQKKKKQISSKKIAPKTKKNCAPPSSESSSKTIYVAWKGNIKKKSSKPTPSNISCFIDGDRGSNSSSRSLAKRRNVGDTRSLLSSRVAFDDNEREEEKEEVASATPTPEGTTTTTPTSSSPSSCVRINKDGKLDASISKLLPKKTNRALKNLAPFNKAGETTDGDHAFALNTAFSSTSRRLSRTRNSWK